jgi:hypothetical protein
MPDAPDYPPVLVLLKALPSDSPPPNRLKQLLKVALRRFGFKCEAVTWQEPPAATHQVPQDSRSGANLAGGPSAT